MDRETPEMSSADSLQHRLEELQRRADRDALSGLMNRGTLERRIRERLARMTPEDACALFIVDLDNFKQVNDTLGHRAGDQAIRQSARILSRLFRAGDIVGRLGGDEFAVFLCGQVSEKAVRDKAAAICENLHLALGDHEIVNVTASVGVHLAGKGQAFEGLYQAADLALYKAKKAGKHRFCLKGKDGYQEARPDSFRPVSTITLSSLLEKMESGVALLEMGERPQVIYVSPSLCRIVGANPDTCPMPRPLAELLHPDDLNPLLNALRDGLRRGESVEQTCRVRAGDRQGWRWWQIRAAQTEYDGGVPVMLLTTMDVSGFKEVQQRQKEEIQRLWAAFEQTPMQLWEVDLRTGRFRSFGGEAGTLRPGEEEIPFPEGLIAGGWVHPDSVPRFRAFARELLGGCARGHGNFSVRSRGREHYGWISASYRMLTDDVGRPARAVGVMEALPQGSRGPGMWAPGRHRLPERLMADLIMGMRANLELDTVEMLWAEDGELSARARETPCSRILELERQKIFRKEEQKRLEPYFDREQLLAQFRAGKRWLCAEYRRVDSAGSIRWVRFVLHLTEDPASRQISLLACQICLDAGRSLGRAIRAGARRDEVSQLFSRDTVQQIAEELFGERGDGSRAVAILRIHGLPAAPADGLSAEQMRREIAAGLSLVMGGSCVLGQYSPVQTVLVFPAAADREALRRQVEEGLGLLRQMLLPEPVYSGLRFIVGISMLPAHAAEYHAMLAQAVLASSLRTDTAADAVVFAQESGSQSWAQLLPTGEQDQVLVRSAEMERPLSIQEKDVAFDCMSAMLAARTLDASLSGVLRTIGTYYRADRVYTLLLAENRRAVIMTFEWTGPGKHSIQLAVSGMNLARFPLLERCMAERAPVFLARAEQAVPEAGGAAGTAWHFTAFPLIRKQEVEGFLCIENAREHPEDAALFSTLIPYMLQERERFRAESDAAGTVQHLMGLPDWQAYARAEQTLTSEHFSSLGAVCLDIPGGRRGFEKGSRILWYVAKTLTDLFGASLLFRIWETEFVAFLPDTTREVFLGRCGRLRSILQRRYPAQVRIGRAWAENVFTAKRLVKEARAAMRAVAAGVQELSEAAVLVGRTELRADERVTVYLQPKIDMRTGMLAGAEALVRRVAGDGSLIPPSQFIEQLEEDGTIRELDFLVLDRALARAEQWRLAGLGTVPVAVNLSRATIVHPSALASILALQSRYPAFPPEALELEITERGDIVGTAELQQIVDEFHACSLRLSLDDFGSQYANLSLFANVRFDTVKLDRSLIAEVVSNPISRTLVQDIVRICCTHEMACVAEGVETREQVEVLLEAGCTFGQGFYYDRPISMEEFERKYLCASVSAEPEGSKEDRV